MRGNSVFCRINDSEDSVSSDDLVGTRCHLDHLLNIVPKQVKKLIMENKILLE